MTGHLPAERRPVRPLAAQGPVPGRRLAICPGLSALGPRRARGKRTRSPASASLPPHPRARTRGAPWALLGSRGVFLRSNPPEMDHAGPSHPGPYSQVVGRDDPAVRPDGEAVFHWTRLGSLLPVKPGAGSEARRAGPTAGRSAKAPRQLGCWVRRLHAEKQALGF